MAVVGAAALSLMAGLPGVAYAEGAAPPPLPAYRPADGAKPVEGKLSTADAPQIEAGNVYEDKLAPGERVYRLVLEKDESDVYVSTVVRPAQGEKVSSSDGIEVEIMTTAGRSCPGSAGRANFGYDAYPISAAAVRWGAEDKDCAPAGIYYVKVTRTSAKGSDQNPWPLEIKVQREPGRGTGGPTTAPGAWPSGAPVLPGTEAVTRTGGTGFNDARALGTGVWRDEMRPGQTRFYRVPVDWGQQLGLGAELSAAKMTRPYGSASGGLTVSLYSPFRSLITDKDTSYDGKQAGITLEKTPPLAYENRFSSDRAVQPVSVAGWYYIAVTMGGKVAEFTEDAATVPLTLRLDVGGTTAKAPAYKGSLAAGGFGVDADDRAAAKDGLTEPEAAEAAGNKSAMQVVAGAGFGTGTLLLLFLGGWTLLGRRGRGPTSG
uniref:Peptidase n=1 Tax=Streptomyces sp. NBC_00049 TaxID=2903617 RepID=A0AAU2JTS9_9ACTN